MSHVTIITRNGNLVSSPRGGFSSKLFFKLKLTISVYRKWSNKPPGAYLTKSVLPMGA